MMMKLFFLLCSASVFAQSAWVKAKGELYTQVSYNTISNYNTIFNQDGADLKTSRNISDQTLSFYAEYGLAEQITLAATVPLKRLIASGTVVNSTLPLTIQEGSLNTLGNVNVAVRRKIKHDKWALATQLQLDLPTGKYEAQTGLRAAIDAYTITPSFSFGKGKSDLFFQSSFGLFFRTHSYSNGLFFNVEGGKKFFNQLWIIPFVNIVDSFADGDVNVPIQNAETFTNLDQAQYGGFGLKLIEEFTPKFGVTAAFGGAFFAHLEAKTPSYNVGLYYKFKPKKKS